MSLLSIMNIINDENIDKSFPHAFLDELTWDMVISNPDWNWNWFHISHCNFVTWEIISNNLDKPWSWWFVSSNPNITFSIIQSNPDYPWDWLGVSANPNITWKVVYDNQDKPWNWAALSNNDMYYDSYFTSSHYKKKMCAKFWNESKEEFIARTWHPDRVDCGWCLDEIDRKERVAFYGI